MLDIVHHQTDPDLLYMGLYVPIYYTRPYLGGRSYPLYIRWGQGPHLTHVPHPSIRHLADSIHPHILHLGCHLAIPVLHMRSWCQNQLQFHGGLGRGKIRKEQHENSAGRLQTKREHEDTILDRGEGNIAKQGTRGHTGLGTGQRTLRGLGQWI